MMTWNEREAYKDIAQLCEARIAFEQEEEKKLQNDTNFSQQIRYEQMARSEGKQMAYRDIIYEITKILGAN